MDISLNVDGPHSPDYTREVADAISEGVRTLNYATQKDGVQYPSHVYDVLGSLAAAAAGQPQALRQMQEWLHGQVAQGRAREHAGGHYGGDTEAAYAAYAEHTDRAAAAAEELYRHLSAAQNALSGMEGRMLPGEDPDDD